MERIAYPFTQIALYQKKRGIKSPSGQTTTQVLPPYYHPTSHVAQAGLGRELGVWDAKVKQQVRRRELPIPATCLCYAPSGLYIAVGFVEGST